MKMQTVFELIAVLLATVLPVLTEEGYSGEVPAMWLPIVGGLTAGLSLLIRWYRDKNPAKAEAMNL